MLLLYFNKKGSIKMEFTQQKIALIKKILNAKLTKEELNQVIDKAESLKTSFKPIIKVS